MLAVLETRPWSLELASGRAILALYLASSLNIRKALFVKMALFGENLDWSRAGCLKAGWTNWVTMANSIRPEGDAPRAGIG